MSLLVFQVRKPSCPTIGASDVDWLREAALKAETYLLSFDPRVLSPAGKILVSWIRQNERSQK